MLLRSPHRRLVDLVGNPPLQVGQATSISDSLVTVQFPEGGTVQVRGTATVGSQVYVRGDAVVGPAPSLPIDLVEI